LDLPPERSFMGRWWHSPDSIVALWPEWFYRPQPDWPKHVQLCGFPLWDGSHEAPLPEHVARFLEAGEPPVIFTPGTLNRHARKFFAAAIETCQRLKVRGMLISRFPDMVPAALPPGVRHFEHVPFNQLLPRVRAMVHHGGTGTTALCLSAGLPQVVVPMSFSQPDIAARVVRLGVGREVRLGWFSGRRLASALKHVLTSSAIERRCQEVAQQTRRSSAFEAAANEIIAAENRHQYSPMARR
jgi:UDP:flavonoid glycosyltransferase YjiC (YdhE family)